MVISSGARPDLVAWWLACLARKPEDQDRFPDAHIFSVRFFFLFFSHFNALLHILVKGHHQNDRNGHPRTFNIELRMKPMGWG